MGSMILAAGFAGDTMPGRFNDGGGHHPFMVAMMILVCVAVVGALIWALVSLSRAKKQSHATSAVAPTTTASALQILDERLARGEIEPADYEARKRLLA